MIDYLRQSGQLEKTVVIFSSDHGQTLGSHGGLVDKGWHHFEEIQRIPLIIRLPGQRSAEIADLVSLIDIYPTILDLAGADWDAEATHGASLVPLLEGSGGIDRDMVATEFDGLNNIAMSLRTVRWGHMKYGFSCGSREQLYDLGNDPFETLNLIDHPEYRSSAIEGRQRLIDWMKSTGDRMSWWYRHMHGYLRNF
jgi:arylsulfatase A-like enzyme